MSAARVSVPGEADAAEASGPRATPSAGEGRAPGAAVLVVSGFLGSGKTTLVRDQLQRAQAAGVRMAVISNELGALGIDRALFGGDQAGYAELEGGCVCCQLSDQLLETLERLRREVDPERIVIETSGAALPYETQLQLWREPVSRWIADDLSLVVVDADQLASGRELHGLFEDQVGSADLLLLNKIDRVPPGELARLERALAELAPDTPRVRGSYGRVDSELLFLPDAAELEAGRRRERRRAAPRPAAEHRHGEFQAEVLEIPEGIPEAELRRLLAERAPLRAKGFVVTERGLRLVQGVGPRIELLTPLAPPAAPLIGRLVAIRRRPGPAASS
jgi:cobalamin biosynthesis protein CobW